MAYMYELEVRPEVAAFAEAMERRLRANDHKPGWKQDHPLGLAQRAEEECVELANAVYLKATDDILNEAADVGNFAMMVADTAGVLNAW